MPSHQMTLRRPRNMVVAVERRPLFLATCMSPPTSSHGNTLSPDAALARMTQFWAKQSTSRSLASLAMQLVALADQEAQRSSLAARHLASRCASTDRVTTWRLRGLLTTATGSSDESDTDDQEPESPSAGAAGRGIPPRALV
jgi:hypothetical protein